MSVYEHAQVKLPPSINEEEFQECQEFNTDKDLEQSPTDDLFDFMTSQEHSNDQHDQVLQTYQANQQTDLKLKLQIDKSMLRSLTMLLKQTKQNMVL